MKTKKSLITASLLLFCSVLAGAIVVEAGVTFTVDSTIDAVDANPGDGICATTEGECTLRAAIQETNALIGADTIHLPIETFTLALPGANEDASASGDLDITDDLSIIGFNEWPDEPWTIIQGGLTDRIFHILPGASVEINYVVITGSDIQDSIDGAGIYNQGHISLYDSNVIENSTLGVGGGIRNDGYIFIEGCNVKDNGAYGGGGIYNSGEMNIYISSINDNLSTGAGGGIYNTEEGRFTLRWSGASSNTVAGSANGGGIYNLGYMELGDIALVSFNTVYGSGGGIYNAGTMLADDLDSSNNFAALDGGALYNTGIADIRASIIWENTASSGAGIYSEWLYETNPSPPTVTLVDSFIQQNNATILAGGILSSISNFTIENTLIENNTANIAGGIATFSGEMNLTNATVAKNSATSQGGGIFNFGNLYVFSSLINENSASLGGGFYNNQYAVMTLSETDLTGNSARDGGGLHNMGYVSIADSILQNNTAEIGGGGLYNIAGYADVDHSTFYANNAQVGGAIWNSYSDLQVDEISAWMEPLDESISELFSNTLARQMAIGEKEASLETPTPGVVFVMTSTIGANTATGQGGGIYTLDEVQIVNTTFSDNFAAEGNSIFMGVPPARVVIGNSILASQDVHNNCAGHQSIESIGYNLETGNTCGFQNTGDLANTEPLLIILNDYPGIGLHPRSPAVDAGSNGLCGNSDQRGVPRPIDGTGDGQAICDIGSYEAPKPDLIFADVPLNHWAYDYIIPLYEDGYTAGCKTDPQLEFCPGNTMNRAESSVFVVRGLHPDMPGYIPPTPTTIKYFEDVPVGFDEQGASLEVWFSKWVGELYEQGFTSGCSTAPPLFCPLDEHTRAQATVFYLRMLNGTDFIPDEPTSQTFNDVLLDHWYAPWIQAAFEANLIQPCQTDMVNMLFRPDEHLTRAEAACMMYQAISKQVRGSVLIENDQCCVGGIAGETIQVNTTFQAASSSGTVTEMRVLSGKQQFTASDMDNATWESFATQRTFPVEVVLNFSSFYVYVQYRDSIGNRSPIYSDDISVEGQPLPPKPTPTPIPTLD